MCRKGKEEVLSARVCVLIEMRGFRERVRGLGNGLKHRDRERERERKSREGLGREEGKG